MVHLRSKYPLNLQKLLHLEPSVTLVRWFRARWSKVAGREHLAESHAGGVETNKDGWDIVWS